MLLDELSESHCSPNPCKVNNELYVFIDSEGCLIRCTRCLLRLTAVGEQVDHEKHLLAQSVWRCCTGEDHVVATDP
jgi:hypothetical protein